MTAVACWCICTTAETQSCVKKERESIPLDGIWSFKLDPMNVSIPVKGSGFTSKLPEEIILPGSTDQAGKGYKTQDMTSLRLTRLFEYAGAAWYEKSNVFIPENWRDKEVFVFLERAHWETRAWINGQPAGRQESLSTPHVYRITPHVRFGQKNTIRLRVDNRLIHDIAYAHAISAETQTNWNGVIGKMKICAFDKVYISDLQVYPNRKEKKVKVAVEIVNASESPVRGVVRLQCETINTPRRVTLPPQTFTFATSDSVLHSEYDYPLGDDIFLWDEFDPFLYHLSCTLATHDRLRVDETSVRFGIRDFDTHGTQFTINDRATFIRGTVNSCEFPLTGYPSMDYDAWRRILQTCKDYGLNCVRFHSWCPPEAAFDAADDLGVYLQAENPDWRFTVGDDEATNTFYFHEAERIFKTYGNHPSFAFFCEGNELVGKGCLPFLRQMLAQWKRDTRRLYVAASGYPTVEGSDFYDFYGARPQRWQEGLKGRFNAQPLNTVYDYVDYAAQFSVPMITHEIGQWCVYPDLNQVSKYFGVLKPYNYELFRESLREKNMLDQAYDFHIASGKFQVIQKKEEFESYFRTPGFGGYHLLQLNDFPGQGTSPVGVVDVFYDPKPYVDAQTFRRIQSPQMPLLRAPKFTWTNDERFNATVEFINFGKAPIDNAILSWRLELLPNGDMPVGGGNVSAPVADGVFDPVAIPLGRIVAVGKLNIPLDLIQEASQLKLVVALDGTDVFNEWSIWVYPAKLPPAMPANTLITTDWDAGTKRFLERGGNVLLLADTARIRSDIAPGFSGISWNAVWSGAPPNLLGILCDPQHKALAQFPTEFHSNWQWFDLVRHSKPMLLDHMPYAFKPLIQMIPDWNNPRRIGLAFEARVGKGKLIVTCIHFNGIIKASPVARQLYFSFLDYMAGDDFEPVHALSSNDIDRIFY
jgi:hypothetical protein